ncbi:restriction endonuclease [Stenotrophomonas maltophilia]|uniref:restriction endonuclease n=1 Tax=Stenotrophomonas maltophilia TaxID=40324 RepID=UPI0018EA947C|nr:restriction endonuclease [Stenotrophomonas maltophilia]
MAAAQQMRELRALEKQEKEAARLAKAEYLQDRQAEADDLNAELKDRLEELEGLLLHTLSVNDTISFDSLRHTDPYPGFKAPKDLVPGLAPVEVEVPGPTGFARFWPGAAKRHLAAQAAAHQAHQQVLEQFHRAEAQKKQRLADLRAQHETERTLYEADVSRRNAEVDEFQSAYLAHEPDAVVAYNDMVLTRSEYPSEGFPQAFKLAYAEASKELVIEYDLPEVGVVPTEADYRYVKTRDAIDSKARKASDIKSLYQDIIASIALRTLHEAFEADQANALALVTFNGVVDTHDPTTGQEVRVPVVSVRATKAAFLQLRLERVEKVACLRSLGAQVSNRPDELQAIKPIVEFNMVDKRFIAQSDVLSGLESRPNLLDLTPSEFEALVSNLFSRMGLDTKLTRSSRDGGVDAVAFDTRPVLGGKVVIQAKRYRDTVGVSAVRDLYGTMLNEGASKGILVCTSGYGTEAFNFAKDKPIELIDGGGLLYLLREHAGLDARIAA